MTLPYANSSTKGHAPQNEKPNLYNLIENVEGLPANPSLIEECLTSCAISLKRIADIMEII